MIRIAKISLDIRKDAVVNNEPIILRQGESDVTIEATILNGGDETLQIDFATFVAKKPDGTIVSNDPANISGNVISYPISKHLTESVGKIQDAYFMINNQITTCGFDISIIPSAQLDDTSVNYIPGIESINKFLESAEADWLGRIQQMKAQIDGLDIPSEFKLLMDKALSDAKAQYQPTIDAAEANVESIVADLAAKKLDLTNNSDELNATITTIKAQVASINSFLDNIQKQIIDANTNFTAGQQAEISQSIADLKAQVSQSISDLKARLDALAVLKIGGVNLLTGTAKYELPINGVNGTQTIQKYDDETNYIQYTSNTPMDLMGSWWTSTPKVGQVYTLSADVCGNGYIQGSNFHYEGSDTGSLGRVDLTNDWQRISNTFTIKAISGNWTIYANNSTLLKVKNIKIEKGNVATDWTPAPEDKVNVSDMRKPASDVAGIEEVNTKADTSAVDQLKTDLTNQVSTLQTQINNSAVGTNLLLKTYEPFSMTGNNTSGQWTIMYSLSRRLEKGTTLTMSFDAVSTAPAKFLIQNNGDSNGQTWISYINSTVDTTKKHYVATTTLDGFAQLGVHMILDNVPSTVTITVSNMKLELGSIATDWCPNPSEILTQSDYAKIKAAIVALGGTLS